MTKYKTYIVPYGHIVEVSRQEELEEPLNDKNLYEWSDATENDKKKYGWDKIVDERIPDMPNMRKLPEHLA